MVDDADVTAYGTQIAAAIQELNLTHLKTFTLDDVFSGLSYEQMREQLVTLHGRPVDEIRESVKSDRVAKSLFNGIQRFIFEDQMVIGETGSQNQVEKRAQQIAYQVMQRSTAWSDLIGRHFPRALELSIHPQDKSSDKLGIKLVRSGDPWRTPWHSVALFDGRNYMLVQRKAAEALGAQPRMFQEKYAYYTLV